MMQSIEMEPEVDEKQPEQEQNLQLLLQAKSLKFNKRGFSDCDSRRGN